VSEKTADSVNVSEIMKVMTEHIPFTMLSPQSSDLTSLLQSKETARLPGGMPGAEETANDERDASHRVDPAPGFGGKDYCAC
jgi:hypothetical protein